MNRSCLPWRTRLLVAMPMAALLIALSVACGQDAAAGKVGDPKTPPPTRKAGDEDPPLPTKKAAPGKQARVEVTAPSAEVLAGDAVIATVRRGQRLPFTKKTEEFYLVTVDGKKGWIKREEVREVDAAGAEPAPPTIAAAPAVISAETTRTVKQATVSLRVRLANGNLAEGSGFFAAQRGLVLTNAHVLGMRAAGAALPSKVDVVVHSGEQEEFTLAGRVLAVDRAYDLAVLRVSAAADRLPPPLAVDGSRALSLVQKVYIFGFPFGANLGKNITVSESSVSSIRKAADGSATEVQVNGGMNPGNSGGPVVDSRGVVVGVAVSMIRGTQINFAVPGERVQELLRGRLSQVQLGEAFRDDAEVKLPVRLALLDPLERLRTVQLEVWAGNAQPARPLALLEPKAQAGDGPRKSIAVSHKDGTAHVNVPLPPLAGDRVLWVQPVLTDSAGGKHWARAVAYRPSELPPLERKAAVLEQQFDRQQERTIKLHSAAKVRAFKGANEFQLQDFMELEALETARSEPRGGQFHLFLGSYKFTTNENGKVQPLFPQAQALLRGRNMTFITDASGYLLQRSVPVLNPPNPPVLRLDFGELVDQMANTYEMTCVAMPNRKLQPRDTWTARVPVFLNNPWAGADQSKKDIMDLVLTCTYEGRRFHRGKHYAVISLTGTAKRRTPGTQTASPTVTGTVHFAIDDGYVSLAKMTVESEASAGNLAVVHALDVTLTRSAGNTAGIVATPVARVPGGPVARGRPLVNAALALAAGDPVDCPGKQGCFYKLQQVNFVAGKTYIIEMDKAEPSRLDPFLVLVNPAGQIVAHDDDSGGNLNSRIIYTAPQTGAFRVYATSLAPNMTGKFVLKVSEAASNTPDVAGGDYDRAVAFLRKRDFGQAIPLLEKVVTANPAHLKAQLELGFAYNESRLFDKAIPCLKKAIELEPNNATAHNNLGAAYNGKRLFDEAIPCFKKAIELDANSIVAHGNLGFAYGEKGWFDKAIACYNKVIEHDSNQPVVYGSLGFIHNAKGCYDQAERYLKKAIALSPNTAIYHNNLGFALNAMGLRDQGIPCLKKAIELDAGSRVAHANLGNALSDIGELQQARDAYQKALELLPKSAKPSQHRSARKALEQADALLEMDARLADIVKGERMPKDFTEGTRFGKLCRVRKYYAAAVRLYEQALADDPEAAKKLPPADLVVLARTAILASTGAGNGAPPEAERPKYRAKALAWLRGYLKAQQTAMDKNSAASPYSYQQNIRALLLDRQLDAVRLPALDQLPVAERREWEGCWGEVDTLLQRAEAMISEP